MKGQSAIEYLVTYGWAILVLAILLGILFTSGVFSPSYLISEECNLGPKLPCKFILYGDNGDTKLALQVTNGFGYKIKLSQFSIVLADNKKDFSLDTPSRGLELESGAKAVVKGSIAGYSIPKGTIKRLSAVIEYYSCSEEVNPTCIIQKGDEDAKHIISGRIISRVI